ncbi:hypothetical protein ACLB2K_055052 [Fragaria x ananassa]
MDTKKIKEVESEVGAEETRKAICQVALVCEISASTRSLSLSDFFTSEDGPPPDKIVFKLRRLCFIYLLVQLAWRA